MAEAIWTGAVSGNFSTAGNWKSGAAPGAADNIHFVDSDKPVTEGLNQDGTAYGIVYFDASYSGIVGTTGAYLQLNCLTCIIGDYTGTMPPVHSKQLKLDFGAHATTVIVKATSKDRIEKNKAPVVLIANHTDTYIHVMAGIVSLEAEPDDVGLIEEFNLGVPGAGANDAKAIIGIGSVSALVRNYSGTLDFCGTTDEVRTHGGVTTINSIDAFALVVYDGIVYPDRHGVISSLDTYGGTVDFTRTSQARTVTSWNIYKSKMASEEYKVIYVPNIITITNEPVLQDRVMVAVGM